MEEKRRATGMIFAAIVFALKAGLGFGGAMTGYLLALYGYVPNAAQTETALRGIQLTMSVFPAVTFGVCIVCLVFYGITKETEVRMTEELVERRKGFAIPAT
jgi:Na+/melibiose symporter-like transporter